MATRQVINGGFQDALGNPLKSGYLKWRLNTDAVVGATGPQICAGQVVTSPLKVDGNIAGYPTANLALNSTEVSGNVLNVQIGNNILALVAIGDVIVFPTGLAASWLNGASITITAFGSHTILADFVHADYSTLNESVKSCTIGAAVNVWPNDQLTPTDTVYIVQAFTAKGQLAWKSEQVVPSGGGAFDLNTWIP